METIINSDGDKLHISDDEVNNNNFVELWFENAEGEMSEFLMVSIDELVAAVAGFDVLKNKREERDIE